MKKIYHKRSFNFFFCQIYVEKGVRDETFCPSLYPFFLILFSKSLHSSLWGSGSYCQGEFTFSPQPDRQTSLSSVTIRVNQEGPGREISKKYHQYQTNYRGIIGIGYLNIFFFVVQNKNMKSEAYIYLFGYVTASSFKVYYRDFFYMCRIYIGNVSSS